MLNAPTIQGTPGTLTTSIGAAGTVTWTMTVPTGVTNPLLIVFANERNGVDPTACTANGVSMVLDSFHGVQNTYSFALFTLANPPTGTVTLVLTYPASAVGICAVSQTLGNVLSWGSSSNLGTAPAQFDGVTIGATTADELVLNIGFNQYAWTGAGASQTVLANLNSGAYFQQFSYATKPLASSVTMTDTYSSGPNSNPWWQGVMSFIAPPIVPGASLLYNLIK